MAPGEERQSVDLGGVAPQVAHTCLTAAVDAGRTNMTSFLVAALARRLQLHQLALAVAQSTRRSSRPIPRFPAKIRVPDVLMACIDHHRGKRSRRHYVAELLAEEFADEVRTCLTAPGPRTHSTPRGVRARLPLAAASRAHHADVMRRHPEVTTTHTLF